MNNGVKKTTDTVANLIVDEFLVLRCQQGDTEALSSLIAKWQAPFLRFALIVTKEPDLAKDIVQDSWIKIIKALPGLRDPVSFRAWAYRIVNNRCMDVLRKRGRNTVIDALPDDELPDRNPSAIKILEDRDQIQMLLAQLSDKHRSVLALHYLQGFNVREISNITRTPIGTVKSRLSIARDRFKQLLEGETIINGDHNESGDKHESSGPTDTGCLATSI